MGFEIFKTENLAEIYKEQASELVFEAFEEYYRILSEDKTLLIKAIRSQFEEYTDINKMMFILMDNQCIGLVCYHDVTEKDERYLAGLKHLFSYVGYTKETVKKLQLFSKGFDTIETEGIYISRVCISEKYRGSGLAQELINFLVKSNESELYLHVNKNNSRAIYFYKKLGFNEVKHNDYLLLHRGYHGVNPNTVK